MRIFLNRPIILFASLLLLAAPASAIKKWVDENGQVHYGTTIPPEYVSGGHSELNQRGIEVDRVDRAKTPEEIAQERELAQLRAAQKRELEEQRARDRVLLNMYRNEDDLLLERNGKLARIDSLIELKQTQVERLKQRLATWQAAAADAERRGSQLTNKQKQNIESVKAQLEAAYASIVEQRDNRNMLQARYDRDLARLRQLRHVAGNTSRAEAEAPEDDAAAMPELDGVFVCASEGQCDQLWEAAVRYAREHATTPTEVEGKRILMTRKALNPGELSITLSRISRDSGERLFLDLQCAPNSQGQQFCNSEAVRQVRDNFNAHLKAHR